MGDKVNKEVNMDIITINDIARDLKMSKTTVSRAISGKGRISDETRKRVLEYIEEHNYRPNLIAKSLAEKKTFNIGVVLPKDENSMEMPFFQKCLMGASGMAASRDYDIVVVTADDQDMSQLERVIKNSKVDGFILTRVFIDDKCIALFKKNNIPFIVIGSFHDKNVLQIDHDHKRAARELVDMLIEREMSRIAFIGEDLNSIVNLNRYQGYVDSLSEHEMKVCDEIVFFVASRAEIDTSVKTILEKGADCILCMDDFICNNVISSLEKLNLKVPKDMKVASLYNSVYLADRAIVPSIDFDVTKLGEISCKLLLNTLAGEEVSHKTLLDYEIDFSGW